MRAAVYARVSTERQERQETIASQLAALCAWAEAGGHELSDGHVFRDEGYSGSRLDRPGLDALRDAVRDGEVDVVAVLAPDRLARKYAYQVLLLEEFRRVGCAVAFLNHAISDDPGDQLLLQIQGAVAEYERALLAERFRRGKLQKARAGQFIGVRAPYGYRYLPRRDGAGGQLVVDEAEAETVRRLYGWLTEERLTLRQILKRLNFGPWFPRCGRRPWSPSTVHHILADPVYAGTAYANRYEYVPARKPRSRKPSYAGKGCRKLRPREQWIAIPVPALVDQDLWDRAQLQLARNAALSFRNNTKHDYLLRCLLTCGACGLAMSGITRRVATTGAERRSYRCAGKDCVATARSTPCPRAPVPAEDLERAVWDHVRGLLGDPERLLAQFQQFAGDADRTATRELAAEQRLRSRLEGLARADRRLLDAYQAEVISLEELTERRWQLADQRRALGRQLDQQRGLRQQRAKAREVLTDLTAFCTRVRGRLDDAALAAKQAVLQLVIERVIVHDASLEIRHVIPLRNPPPGRDGPAEPDGRLRSDRVSPAPLPRRAREDGGHGLLEALVVVGDDQPHAREPARHEVAQEGGPAGAVLARDHVAAQHLAVARGVDADGGDRGDVDHAPAVPAALAVGVEPDIGVGAAVERPAAEGGDQLVQLLGDLRHPGPGQAVDAERLDQALDPAHGDAAQVALGHDLHDRALGPAPRLQQPVGEVGALAELGDLQRHRAQPGVPGPVAVAVAPVDPLRAAFAVAGAAQLVGLGAHQGGDHHPHHLAQEVRLCIRQPLAQPLQARQATLDHRVVSSGIIVANPENGAVVTASEPAPVHHDCGR